MIFTLRLFLVALTLLFGCHLIQRDNSIKNLVVKRVTIPQYPSIAAIARVEGKVVIKIKVDEKGKVVSTETVEGSRLLRKAAEEATQAWLFEPTGKSSELQEEKLTFIFKLMPPDTQFSELSSTFNMPNTVEIRASIPKLETHHSER